MKSWKHDHKFNKLKISLFRKFYGMFYFCISQTIQTLTHHSTSTVSHTNFRYFYSNAIIYILISVGLLLSKGSKTKMPNCCVHTTNPTNLNNLNDKNLCFLRIPYFLLFLVWLSYQMQVLKFSAIFGFICIKVVAHSFFPVFVEEIHFQTRITSTSEIMKTPSTWHLTVCACFGEPT